MSRCRRLEPAKLALTALAFACAAAQAAPERIALPTQVETPVVASAIVDYPSAARAIIGVLTQTLHLPMPAYTLEVHSDAAEFEQALVRYLALAPDVARSTASFAKAAVGSRRILVNERLMGASPWPERLVTMAHEMVHASQLELSGHRSLVRNQWLVEGFADWIAFRVVDELGTRRLLDERTAMVAQVSAARAQAPLAPLVQLDTFAQWVDNRKQRGFNAAYPYAYLATDFLITRHSYDKVLAYFRLHRQSADSNANFEAAFGESLAQFQQGLDANFSQLLK